MVKESLFKHINKVVPFIELFTKALSFIGVIIITRLLSVEEFGVYYYVVSIVAWASVFMDGGISYFIINKSIKDELENLGHYLVSRVTFSLITIIILCFVVGVLKQGDIIYVLLYSISFLFILLTAFFKIVARTQGKVKLDIVTIVLEPLIRVLILLALYFSISKVNLSTIFVVLLITALLGFSLSFMYFKKQIPLIIRPTITLKEMIDILKETKSYLLMYLFLVGLKRVEIIIANFRFSKFDSGLYSSADNFYNSAYLFFTALILIGLKKHYVMTSKEKQKNLFNIAAVSFFSVVFLYFFSDVIYSIFYKDSYIQGSKILSIISLSLLCTPFTYFFILNNNYNNKININVLVLGFSFVIKVILLLFAENIFIFSYFVVGIDLIIIIIYSLLSLKKPKNQKKNL
ncbi:oligosaccharide flippase family protein [Yeosuana marina]|uniref:oligosaccharide flippase family protein n=1 Tax=Yeosuana marina TaxID=1565536 RepID=UPI001422E3BA|nr:oligosaccharide flippase family protein [Yeosuana marina]